MRHPGPCGGRVFRMVAALLFLPGTLCFAQGAAFPSRPITIIVNSVAGGPVDNPARAIKDPLAAILGQPVIVDNRPSASGTTGAGLVAKSPPNGYTLLLTGAGPIVTSPQLVKNLPYEAQELAPIAFAGYAPLLLVVGPASEAKTLAELVALARRKPGQVTFATAGNGTPTHVSSESLKALAGVELVHVPYRGLPQMMLAVMSNEVSMAFTSLTFMEQVRSGKLRALAVSSSQRLKAAPELPTFAEQGFADLLVVAWFGLFAPVATPPEIQAQLSQAALKALADPQARELYARYHGVEPNPLGPAEFAKIIQSDRERIGKMIASGRIQAE